MTDALTKNYSVFPEKMRILSGSVLKVLAMIIMLIDHTTAIILVEFPNCQTRLFTLFGNDYSIYRIGRYIGRIAFPIFCFLLVEGFFHTRSRARYARNLFIFALISEIPWNIIHNGTLIYPTMQNVYFTLLFGFLGMWAAEQFKDNQFLVLLCLAALLAISMNFHADYRYKGYILIIIMYYLRKNPAAMAILSGCWMSYEWRACYAFLPINMYNGKRGFIKGKAKYIFYVFYPLHLSILAIIQRIMFHS